MVGMLATSRSIISLIYLNHRPWLTGNEDPFTALTGVTTSPLRNGYESRRTRKELIFYLLILEIG